LTQKTALEEITVLFPEMFPKTIMAETLRVLDAGGTTSYDNYEGEPPKINYRRSLGGEAGYTETRG